MNEGELAVGWLGAVARRLLDLLGNDEPAGDEAVVDALEYLHGEAVAGREEGGAEERVVHDREQARRSGRRGGVGVGVGARVSSGPGGAGEARPATVAQRRPQEQAGDCARGGRGVVAHWRRVATWKHQEEDEAGEMSREVIVFWLFLCARPLLADTEARARA
jgi:hypothetical protein